MVAEALEASQNLAVSCLLDGAVGAHDSIGPQPCAQSSAQAHVAAQLPPFLPAPDPDLVGDVLGIQELADRLIEVHDACSLATRGDVDLQPELVDRASPLEVTVNAVASAHLARLISFRSATMRSWKG